MPIRPENKARYPENWKEIRADILKRADSRCEFCGIKNYTIRENGSKVILTIAHLDHTPENCDYENLRALCQKCHNNYDKDHRAETRKQTRERISKMENQTKRHKIAVNLSTSILHPHPKNPRKNLGDLTELTESIKKNGIMQNLTVIPGFYKKDGKWFNTDAEYTVIIGHRRLEAAKAAGLTEVPCRIYENLPENDQIATMLEENMQRNDLTVYEQAQSFQLMLDLGETVETLSEKTGFKKTTIYHRLNIAKLDQEYLKELEEDDSFQLTLNDLIELEKIEDIKKRDKILKEARSSNDLRFKAQQAAKEEKLNKKEKQWREYLEGSLADEGEQSMKWSGRYEKIYEQDLREDKEFDPEKEVGDLITDDTYYVINYGYVTLLEEKTDEKEEDDDEPETDNGWEIARKERETRQRSYDAVRNPLKEETHDFVKAIVEEKLKNPDKEDLADITETLFKLFIDECDIYNPVDEIIEFLYEDVDTRDELTEEYKQAHDKVLSLPMYKNLLILIQGSVNDIEFMDRWDGKYLEDNTKFAQRFYYILERWDWNTQKEEAELLNGTANYYTSEEEDDDEDDGDDD